MHDHPVSANQTDLCLTRGCIQSASNILNYIDVSVDPCRDFHQFACGNIPKNPMLPPGIFELMNSKLQAHIPSLIMLPSHSNNLRAFNLVNKFYKLCMNTTQIEKHGLQQLLDILEKVGGWPVIKGDQWNPDWNWTNVVREFRKMGFRDDYIISTNTAVHFDNSTTRILLVILINRNFWKNK